MSVQNIDNLEVSKVIENRLSSYFLMIDPCNQYAIIWWLFVIEKYFPVNMGIRVIKIRRKSIHEDNHDSNENNGEIGEEYVEFRNGNPIDVDTICIEVTISNELF